MRAVLARWRDERPLLIIGLLALAGRLVYLIHVVDVEYDGYDRFLKGITLLSDPLNLGPHWAWLPLPQFLDAALYGVTQSYRSARVFSTSCGVLSIAVLYRLTGTVFKSRRAALAASALMAFNPLILLYDASGMTESCFTLLFLSATLLLVHDRLFSASLVLALACLVRYEAWVMTFLFLILALLRRRRSPLRVLAATLLPLGSIVGWLGANLASYGDAFHFLRLLDGFVESWTGSHSGAALLGVPPQAWPPSAVTAVQALWYGGGLFIWLTPLVFLAALFGLLKAVRKSWETRAITLLALCFLALVSLLLVSGKSLGWPRHVIACMPLFISAAASVAVDTSVNPRRFLVVSLLLSLLVAAGMAGYIGEASQSLVQTSTWLRENVTTGKVLCDSSPVIVLSALPYDTFLQYWDVSSMTSHLLATHQVNYVVSTTLVQLSGFELALTTPFYRIYQRVAS